MRYKFAPYKGINSKGTCPSCGAKNHWCKFIDTETDTLLPEKYGKCDNSVKCGYQYTPIDHPPSEEDMTDVKILPKEEKDFYNILPQNILTKSLKNKYCDNFSYWLIRKYGNKAKEALDKYLVGCHKKKNTVFWQVDESNQIHGGKIIKYNEITGKRSNQITWVHSQLKLEDFQLQQSLFGAHLINQDKSKKIGFVEGEKTAVICSIIYPNVIWVAGGQLQCLQDYRLNVLKGREVIFYPDRGCYDTWKKKLEKMSLNFNYKISRFIEDCNDLQIGDDIADWVLNNNMQPK